MINAVRTAAHPAPLYAVIAPAAIVVVVGINLFPLAVDDAYITYSSARNLARVGRLVYHPTNPELNISAPLYAFLLGAGGRMGLPIPALSNVLGVASIFGSSAYLMALCYRYGKIWAALTAGLLLAASPLLWLTLGLESSFFLLLALAAFYHFDRERYVAAAVLTAGAILTRADGVLVAGLLGLYHLVVLRRRVPWNAVAAFLVVMIPAVLYLTLSFGSPLPTTLQTKVSQAAIGFSGFYVGTTFAQALPIMLGGWLDQSSLHYLWAPSILLGLLLLLRSKWIWGIVAWGTGHFAAYIWLDVAPYHWYYVPLVPGAVLLVGLGFQMLADWVERVWLQCLLVGALLLSLCLAQVISLMAVVSGINAERPPTPVQSKVVPNGAASALFRAIGEWLQANTPRDATVAVNDVGMIGYFADRAMIDFLGILQPDVAQALNRRDLFYLIPHFLPDYIVLGENLVIFDIWLHGDPWFAAHYKPVHRFTDSRFERLGGEPFVAFQRVSDPAPMLEQETDTSFLAGLTLDRFAIDRTQLTPGDWMRVRLNWHVLRALDSSPSDMVSNPILKITAFLTDKDGEAVTEQSASDVLTTFQTEFWAEDEISPVYTPVHVPADLTPGAYDLQVRLEEDGDVRVTRQLTVISVKGAPER